MRAVWRNERGGTLLYVLMCMMVLLISAPVLMTSMSTNAQQTVESGMQKDADQLALSAMGTFIVYLNAIPNTQDRVTYFQSYGGWTQSGGALQPKTIVSPEGVISTMIFYPCDASQNPLTNISDIVPGYNSVLSEVTTGSGVTKRTKSFTYTFTVTAGSGGGGTPPPGGGTSTSTNELVSSTSYGTTSSSGSDLVLTASDLPAGETFQSLYDSLLPVSYNYTVYSFTELVNTMNSLMNAGSGAEYTIQCQCSTTTTPENGVYDFLINDDRTLSTTFVINWTGPSNTTSDFTVGKKGSWIMKGMMLINGSLHTDQSQSFYSVDNTVCFGVYDPAGGSSSYGYIATVTYNSSGTSTTPSLPPSPITYQYEAQGYTSPWSPSRTS